MNRVRLYHLLVLLMLLAPVVRAQGGASSPEPKRVLLLYFYGPENPERMAYDEGFRDGLRSFGPGGVEFYSETLETYRFPGGDHDEVLRDYMRRKYSATRLDAVAAVADSALEFALRYRDDLFPGVPIVYSAAARPKLDPRQAGVTGLWQGPKMRATVELALQVHPETKQVYVISGKLNNNGLLEAAARAQIKSLEQRASINYLTDLPIDELVDRVGKLPEKSVVFILRQAIGAEGRSIAPGEATTLIARAANAPVYVGVDTWIGDGVVGGEVASQGRNAFELAQLAVRVATGTKPEEIPPREMPGVKMFNWRELKRWGISEDQLPPGSVVRFREFTFWELYKWHVVGVLALCAVEALLILGLMIQRARRARAEESRRLSEEKFSKAFRASPDAFVIAKRSDGTIIEVNDRWEALLGYGRAEAVGRTALDLGVYVEPRDRQKFIALFEQFGFVYDFETDFRNRAGAVRRVVMSAESLTVNDEPCFLVIIRDVTERKRAEEALGEREQLLRTMFASLSSRVVVLDSGGTITYASRSWDEFAGANQGGRESVSVGVNYLDVCRRAADEGDQSARDVLTGIKDVVSRERPSFGLEYACHSPSERRWFLMRVDPMPPEHGGAIVSHTDISDLKRAEGALRESEERFRTMADTAPVLIWVAGADNLRTYFNREWLEFTGRTLEQERGDGWAEGLHPDDRERYMETYRAAFDARRGFLMEYRIRRHDGEHRWVTDAGVPRFTPDGAFTGYIGSAIDVTERMKSEQALQDLTGRLIRLQDEERRRIAAELHDSLGQSLAIIKNRATICRRDTSDVERVSEQLEEITTTAAAAIEEVREIAHNLRPYELDRLGLAEAVESMVAKVSDATSLRLTSDIDRLDGLLTPEAETSVYRIVQEGLNNVVRHAGATEACVGIKRREREVVVTVRDNGTGLRARAATAAGGNGKNGGGGFGLAGIAERARMLGADYGIDSAPGRGTTLTVRLELTDESDAHQG